MVSPAQDHSYSWCSHERQYAGRRRREEEQPRPLLFRTEGPHAIAEQVGRDEGLVPVLELDRRPLRIRVDEGWRLVVRHILITG
jgi:hypothetical protein